MWNDLKNKIISYADDTTLYAEVASPSERTNVVNSLTLSGVIYNFLCFGVGSITTYTP